MAAFDEVQFRTDISLGAQGGPEFRTRVITLGSGFERRNQDWPSARASYNLARALETPDQIAYAIAFHRARRGKARGFRFKDWSDYTVGISDQHVAPIDDVVDSPQQFGEGDGYTSVYGLIKAYTDGVVTVNRDITKPVSGTVHIFIDSVEVIEGSDWSLDYTTGLVTFSAPLDNGSIPSWGGHFDTPVRFDTDHLNVTMVEREIGDWSQIPIVEVRVSR